MKFRFASCSNRRLPEVSAIFPERIDKSRELASNRERNRTGGARGFRMVADQRQRSHEFFQGAQESRTAGPASPFSTIARHVNSREIHVNRKRHENGTTIHVNA